MKHNIHHPPPCIGQFKILLFKDKGYDFRWLPKQHFNNKCRMLPVDIYWSVAFFWSWYFLPYVLNFWCFLVFALPPPNTWFVEFAGSSRPSHLASPSKQPMTLNWRKVWLFGRSQSCQSGRVIVLLSKPLHLYLLSVASLPSRGRLLSAIHSRQ